MKNIVLFCTGGMSTGILVNNIRQKILERGLEYEINAYSEVEADTYGPAADVILVGPQVSYVLDELRQKFPDVPVECIDVETYSLMKGEDVLDRCVELLEGEE